MEGKTLTAAGGEVLGGTGSALLLVSALTYRTEGTPAAVVAVALVLVAVGAIGARLAPGRTSGGGAVDAAVLGCTALVFAAGIAAIGTGRWEAAGAAAIAGAALLGCQALRLKASVWCLAPPERRPFAALTLSTALVEGTAALVLYQLATEGYRHALAVAMAMLIVLRLFLWLACLKRLRGAQLPATIMARLDRFNTAFVFFGNAVPAILVANSIFTPGLMHGMVAAAAVVGLVAGWHLKITLRADIRCRTQERP